MRLRHVRPHSARDRVVNGREATDYALDWLGYRFPAFQRLVRPAPLPLVRNGKLLYANMRRELVTREELMTQLRRP
jgi:uncharacterized membrane protein YcaP (DUF421 family)